MPTYCEHISDVFIKPIRSVLAIDDQFPTLEMLLAREPQYALNKHSDRLADLIKYCRDQYPHWMVDVHNGAKLGTPEMQLTEMRQSNWLILDYKLDGEAGNGSRAISALRTLASSDHFKLVVVYTGEPPELVFREIVVSLSKFTETVSSTSEEESKTEKALDELGDTDPEIIDKFKEQISTAVCFKLIANKSAAHRNGNNADVLAGFHKLLEQVDPEKKNDAQLLLNYLFSDRIKKFLPADAPTFDIDFAQDPGKKYWLVAGNIFVVIEGKTTEPSELLSSLRKALEEWQPSPNQLIIAKLRAELDAAGISGDRAVVSDKNMQAFWLNLLLESDPREEAHHVGIFVDRESELLADRLRSDVTDFALGLITEAKKVEGNSAVITEKYLGVNPLNQLSRDSGIISHNTHVSSKPPTGKNLTPGHIFRLNCEDQENLWICLSPACDLEAGREEGRDLKTRIKPWMPVTLVKLHKMNANKALEHASRGWVVFVEMDGKKGQYSYFPSSNPNLNPVWEEFFAENEGRLSGDGDLKLARIVSGQGEDAMPTFEEITAKLLAQLRSEYAANLTLRLTTHLSRIGLDYHSNKGP